MVNLPEQTLTTGIVRLSYTHLFKPYASNPAQEAKYSTTILVPKTDLGTKQAIDMAIDAAKRTGAAEKFQGVIPPILSIPVHDGDGRRPSDGLPFGDECKGHWVFTASSKKPIEVVGTDRNPIINQSDMYSGVYAYVSVTFFPYNSNGRKGIGCGLNCVMKAKDGEPLGAGVSASKAFANIPAQPFAVPSYPAAPQSVPKPTYIAPAPQPAYAASVSQSVAPAPQPQINPITGLPIVPGGVMGL